MKDLVKGGIILIIVLIFVYSPNTKVETVRKYTYIVGQYVYNYSVGLLVKSEDENLQKAANFITGKEETTNESTE